MWPQLFCPDHCLHCFYAISGVHFSAYINTPTDPRTFVYVILALKTRETAFFSYPVFTAC